ncbi:MAG: GxxExxY protein [Spirochaetes bacterium]|nr:GxxExxY protein [Spirochaetota bacterium]
MEKLLYRDLFEKIIGCAFEVYKTLGYGFLEKVYHNAFLHELKLKNIKYNSEYLIKVKYKDIIAGNYCADILIEDKIIVEIKVEKEYNSIHEVQLLNYLKATGIKIGLIINFGRKKCDFKRMIF